MVIDPGMEPGPLLDLLEKRKLRVERILLTHAHLDHIAGCTALHKAYGCPIHLHPGDRFLYDGLQDFGRMYGFPLDAAPALTEDLAEGQCLPLGDGELAVLETPGHSPGGVCFHARMVGEADLLFCGDTLFVDSYGRTDLPGGDETILRRSIVERLFRLDPQTRFLPGHGPEGTIGYEALHNPIRITG